MKPITKNTLGDKVTTLLRHMLMDGQFKEGEHLMESRIATELGISRTPLREALHRLAQEGLLKKRRAGGYALSIPDPREMEDAFDIRCILESHTAELAAARATTAQIENLHCNQSMFHAANAAHDVPQLVNINSEFHAILRQAAHSPQLVQILSELDGIIERMLRRILSRQNLDWSYEDHQKILLHVEARDAAGAAACMRQHVECGKKKVLEHLKKH